MKTFVTTTIAALGFAALSTAAIAEGWRGQIDVDTFTGSESTAIIIQEGDEFKRTYQAPPVGAPGNMHTAPCIVGKSMGLSVPGFGISNGTGVMETNCNNREETAFLAQVMNMPNGPAKTAALAHLCYNDASLQTTLVAMGVCKLDTSAPQRVQEVIQNSVHDTDETGGRVVERGGRR